MDVFGETDLRPGRRSWRTGSERCATARRTALASPGHRERGFHLEIHLRPPQLISLASRAAHPPRELTRTPAQEPSLSRQPEPRYRVCASNRLPLGVAPLAAAASRPFAETCARGGNTQGGMEDTPPPRFCVSLSLSPRSERGASEGVPAPLQPLRAGAGRTHSARRLEGDRPGYGGKGIAGDPRG